MADDTTSIPGPGNDPLEPEFEKELRDEGFELEGREAPADKPKPESEKKDPEKPEDKQPEAEADKDPKKPEKAEDKDPKDPAKKEEPEEWRKMIAKKRQDQGKSKAGDPEKPADPAKPDADPSKPKPESSESKTPELTEEQKNLADKYGIEHEDFHKLFPTPKVEKEVIKSGLSPEQEALLQSVASERDGLLIEKGFNADFDSNVLPLLKEEYPKGLTDEKIAEVKKSILEKLHDDKFAMVPLDVLYRGDTAFRGLVKAPVKGPDTGSKVPAKGDSGKVWDFDTATEEDIKHPDFPFDDYSNYMAKKGNKK